MTNIIPESDRAHYERQLTGAAAKGARFLDSWWPQWFNHIDLDDLDMAESTDCVLGQIFRDEVEGVDGFQAGVCSLDPENCEDGDDHGGFAEENGFDIPIAWPVSDISELYEALGDAWKFEILARRAA